MFANDELRFAWVKHAAVYHSHREQDIVGQREPIFNNAVQVWVHFSKILTVEL